MAQVTKSIIVKGDVEDVYDLWTRFDTFPQFMRHIREVKQTGPRTSHWVVEGPLGLKVDWHAELTRQEEYSRLAWNSKDSNGLVTTSGQVLFNPLTHGETEITTVIQYKPVGGKVGELLAGILGRPEQRVAEDLRCFKSYAEEQRRD